VGKKLARLADPDGNDGKRDCQNPLASFGKGDDRAKKKKSLDGRKTLAEISQKACSRETL
jgi:hypothetical protein